MLKNFSYLSILGFLLSNFCFADYQHQKPKSTVFIDGVEAEVYFNDGDTFKILNGDLVGKRVRIVGFNSLENYGPVHSWINTSAEYLYENSLLAGVHARAASWHCDTLDERDGYGRQLMTCDDLAISLIENGLAHAFTMDSSAAQESYLQAQHYAQENALGMWKYGIPDYIITSLHSSDEKTSYENENKGKTYNRLISTSDGHTEKWSHNDNYGTCEDVCLEDGSCMLYVPFSKRYGKFKAECLL